MFLWNSRPSFALVLPKSTDFGKLPTHCLKSGFRFRFIATWVSCSCARLGLLQRIFSTRQSAVSADRSRLQFNELINSSIKYLSCVLVMSSCHVFYSVLFMVFIVVWLGDSLQVEIHPAIVVSHHKWRANRLADSTTTVTKTRSGPICSQSTLIGCTSG